MAERDIAAELAESAGCDDPGTWCSVIETDICRAAVAEIRDLNAALAEAVALLREAREEYVDDDDLAPRIDALLTRFPEAP